MRKNDVLFWALIPFNLISLTFILILLSSSSLFLFLIIFMICVISFVGYKFKSMERDSYCIKHSERNNSEIF